LIATQCGGIVVVSVVVLVLVLVLVVLVGLAAANRVVPNGSVVSRVNSKLSTVVVGNVVDGTSVPAASAPLSAPIDGG
jgi:capsule polysaccharide export protein KpsE/RkpR